MVDDHAPRPMALECSSCDRAVIGTPVGFTVYYEPSEGPPERWTLLRCPEGHPSLVVQNVYHGIETFDEDPPYRVFPPQDRHLSSDIPRVLRDAHSEARKCFHAKSYVGVVILCGRTLEAACKLHGVRRGTLEAKLKAMREKGLIDGRLGEWANTLRQVRNAAAHADVGDVSRQDAEDVLAYSEALLDYLYVMKARFDALRERRGHDRAVKEPE